MNDIPITLGAAGILGLIFLVLTFRVVRLRVTGRVMLGEVSEKVPAMQATVRAHANFAEYVPLALLLIGGLEVSHAPRALLLGLAGALIFARVIHPIGMGLPAPNMFRAGGAMLTWAMIGIASIVAVVIAI